MPHHRPSPMLGKCFLSVKWISTPLMTVAETVTDAMIHAARAIVSGLRDRMFTARGWDDGGAVALPSGVVMVVTSSRSADTGRQAQAQIRSRRSAECTGNLAGQPRAEDRAAEMRAGPNRPDSRQCENYRQSARLSSDRPVVQDTR